MYGKKASLQFLKSWLDVSKKQIYLTYSDDTDIIDNNTTSRYHLDQISDKSIVFQNKVNALLVENCHNVDITINGTINQIVLTKCKPITLSLSDKQVPTIVTYNVDGIVDQARCPLATTLTDSNVVINNIPYTVVGTKQIIHK